MGSRAAVLSLLVAAGLDAGRATVHGDEGLRVVVVVDDRANVRPLMLDQAQKHASRIYKQAGVKLVWRTAAHSDAVGNGRPTSEAGFALRAIVHARFRGTMGTGSTLMMGAAPNTEVKCGGTVHLFLDQISAYSSITGHDTALVFGTVAAHEIGHVLLGRDGHAHEGLMRASWKPDDWERAAAGFLVFSPHERETVRQRIAGCRHRE